MHVLIFLSLIFMFPAPDNVQSLYTSKFAQQLTGTNQDRLKTGITPVLNLSGYELLHLIACILFHNRPNI